MPEIQRIELERENDTGVEVKKGEHPAIDVDSKSRSGPEGESAEAKRRRREKEEMEQATTPFPGG
jgi:hypothetical protein